MWPLIRKDSTHFVLYIGVMLIILSQFWFGTKKGEGNYFVFMQIFWTFLLISGGISISEKEEEKNNGYLFLRSLPITDREIVLSKIFLSAASALLLTLYNVITTLILVDQIEFKRIVIPLIILWGIFCLIYSVKMYIGIFKHGFTKQNKFFWLYAMGVFSIVIFGNLFFPKIAISLKVIHGIGSGKLRSEIHKRLSQRKEVKYFEDGDKEKFGFGSTIIYF